MLEYVNLWSSNFGDNVEIKLYETDAETGQRKVKLRADPKLGDAVMVEDKKTYRTIKVARNREVSYD